MTSNLQDQGLQAFVAIDRSTASRMGVSIAAIDDALYNAFGQRLVSTIFTQSNQYRVVLEVKPEYRQRSGRSESYPGAFLEWNTGAVIDDCQRIRTGGPSRYPSFGTVPRRNHFL